jgi:cytochrome c-type biogenesis protein CcmH/NrfG
MGLDHNEPSIGGFIMAIKQFAIAVFSIFSIVFSLGAFSADTSSDESAPSWQAEAQKEIKANKYDAAIKTLLAANQSDSADWNNLLGYAQRKKTPPDLAAAERYYQAALKIDPKHRGALEYYGELFLMKNDLAGAEQMLARLNKACFLPCEEYRELKDEIAKYKAQKGIK